MNRETLWAGTSQAAPIWQPRGLAMICFAAAAMLAYTGLFPAGEEIESGHRVVETAVTFAGGLVCWTLARAFRVWMVHGVVLLGLFAGLSSLAQVESALGAALALTALLWVGVFVGAAFDPPVARGYALLVCFGITAGMFLNGVEGDVAIGVAFAGSFVVIMEILSRATSQLRREATTDPLTGLLNRTGLEREVERVRSFGRDDRVAVLVVDLDGFKQVNDREGHQAGDRLLREFAAAWRDGARSGDILARIGGDEFVAVLPEVDDLSARAIVERLREISPAPWSGGLVIAAPGESLDDCIERADRRLYEEKAAKKRGGDGRGAHPLPSVSSR